MTALLDVPVTTNSDWAVETHGLTKRFGANTAVNDVELLVPRGCAFGYLGPNGAGKTTLIRTLLGLTRADSGTMAPPIDGVGATGPPGAASPAAPAVEEVTAGTVALDARVPAAAGAPATAAEAAVPVFGTALSAPTTLLALM